MYSWLEFLAFLAVWVVLQAWLFRGLAYRREQRQRRAGRRARNVKTRPRSSACETRASPGPDGGAGCLDSRTLCDREPRLSSSR